MEEQKEYRVEGFEKCPLCGCEEDLRTNFIAELKKEGMIAEDFPDTRGLKLNEPLYEQKELQQLMANPVTALTGKVTVPNLRYHFGFCAECKHIFLLNMNLSLQDMPVQFMKMPGAQQLPPQ